MNCKVAERIEWVCQAQGPEIMSSWLQDVYLQLRFSFEAVRLLVREQGLGIPERLRVFTDKNVMISVML